MIMIQEETKTCSLEQIYPEGFTYEFSFGTIICLKEEADGIIVTSKDGEKGYFPKHLIQNWEEL